MRIKKLGLALCFAGIALTGCSSKPDVTDIAADLNEGWGLCNGLKISNLKKINGIDEGNSYKMEVSYDLMMTKDFSAKAENSTCPSTDMLNILHAYAKRDGKYLESLKTGDVVNVNDVFNMVKSENGWVRQ